MRVKRHIAPEIVFIRAFYEFSLAVRFGIPTGKNPAAVFSHAYRGFPCVIGGRNADVTQLRVVIYALRFARSDFFFVAKPVFVRHTVVHVHRVERKSELRTNGYAYGVFHVFRPTHFRGFRSVYVHYVIDNVTSYFRLRGILYLVFYFRLRIIRTRGELRAVDFRTVDFHRTYRQFVGIVVSQHDVKLFRVVQSHRIRATLIEKIFLARKIPLVRLYRGNRRDLGRSDALLVAVYQFVDIIASRKRAGDERQHNRRKNYHRYSFLHKTLLSALRRGTNNAFYSISLTSISVLSRRRRPPRRPPR